MTERPLTTKPAIDKVLRRMSIDDRLGAIYGTWQERDDVVQTVVRLCGFIAWLAGKLSTRDRNNLALALREVANHVERKPTIELVG
jgi:hypothetical protein